MEYQNISLEPFLVAGIAVRTTNVNGQSQHDIGALWQRFFSEGTAATIPAKASEDVYCVYTDYESDATGFYTTIIGCKVTSLQNLPAGLEGIAVPAASYRLYKSAGKLPDCVIATWQHIWQLPIDRAYGADFDVYGPLALNPADAVVETYLSVR